MYAARTPHQSHLDETRIFSSSSEMVTILFTITRLRIFMNLPEIQRRTNLPIIDTIFERTSRYAVGETNFYLIFIFLISSTKMGICINIRGLIITYIICVA